MNKQADELAYITSKLLMEFQTKLQGWNAEYASVERDLGIRASFAELWRKAKKIKAAVWDGADTTDWRESVRTILFEIIGHAMLMLYDLDHEAPPRTVVEVGANDQAWVPAPDCGKVHKYGEDDWRPGVLGGAHEHPGPDIQHDHNLFIGSVPQTCPKPGCGYRPSLVPAGSDRFA